MAAAAFKSSSSRSANGAAHDAGSSNRAGMQRRSRSLSRVPGRFSRAAATTAEAEEPSGSGARGRFGNKATGAGFPEISLDDLADEFFGIPKDMEETERGRPRCGDRSGRRLSDAGFQRDTESSRGRSVSRKDDFENNASAKGFPDGNASRRSSLSVMRRRRADTQGYSSTLTDDETWDACEKKGCSQNTVRTVCSHKKVVLSTKPVMKNDEYDIQRKDAEAFEAISEIRRNYTAKLEESEKRKQELLAKLAAEEHRGEELTKIVRELLPDTKHSSSPESSSLIRKRSNEKTRMSKHLSDAAEKYFVNFVSTVEETDISSFDGDKSDESSSIGCMKSPAFSGSGLCLVKASSLPGESDGLILPWLDWETHNDGTLLTSCSMSKMESSVVPGTRHLDPEQQTSVTHDDSLFLTSSHGSWSPDDNESCSTISKNNLTRGVAGAEVHLDSGVSAGGVFSSFEMDNYMHLSDIEDFLLEGLRQRQRIESGGLILCRRSFFELE